MNSRVFSRIGAEFGNYEFENCIERKEEALKAVLKLMKKKAMSYQELNYLSQASGVNLSSKDKRNSVNIRIKDMML